MVITTNALNSAIADTITEFESLFSHMAVGTDGTVALVTDTALGGETIREVLFKESTTATEIRVDIRLDTADNNGNTQREVGVFNQASGGTMYVRDRTTVFAKTNAKEAYYQEVVRLQSTTS